MHRHLNLLETTYQLVRLPAFTVNRTKRLLKTPRVFWCDTGLAMHLAGETKPQGAHLESLVLQDLLAWRDSSPMEAEILYWRTVAGDAEVDFVIEQDGMLLPIEVKTRAPPFPCGCALAQAVPAGVRGPCTPRPAAAHRKRDCLAGRRSAGGTMVAGLLAHRPMPMLDTSIL